MPSLVRFSTCSRIAAHADHGNRLQGIVCRAISASVQTISDRLARRRLQWARATKRRQRSFAFQAFWIVTGDGNQHGSSLWADSESFPKPAGMLAGQAIKHGIERVQFLGQRQPAFGQTVVPRSTLPAAWRAPPLCSNVP